MTWFLSSTQGEDDDEEVKETEEDQDGFFVPHGYLSDDEGVPDEESGDEDGENESDKMPVPKDVAEARRVCGWVIVWFIFYFWTYLGGPLN